MAVLCITAKIGRQRKLWVNMRKALAEHIETAAPLKADPSLRRSELRVGATADSLQRSNLSIVPISRVDFRAVSVWHAHHRRRPKNLTMTELMQCSKWGRLIWVKAE
jgi:hypothetical protein